ncbi:MAG: hypothetical protein IK990_05430 [Ruminiclostridium sp.]|nr:hypothetical protein [Ruminiclostridium sp.]
MELILAAMNPATGTSLPIPLFIISGVILVGCIAAAIIMNVLKKKNGSGMNKRRKRRK